MRRRSGEPLAHTSLEPSSAGRHGRADEGDVDHARIIRILAEAGYADNVDPDHVPDHPDDPGGKQAYAHGYGYLRALMQAVESTLDR